MRGKKGRGRYVKLQDGRKGFNLNTEGLINGKVPVQIIDSNFQPVHENGKPVRLLVHPSKLVVIGFFD